MIDVSPRRIQSVELLLISKNLLPTRQVLDDAIHGFEAPQNDQPADQDALPAAGIKQTPSQNKSGDIGQKLGQRQQRLIGIDTQGLPALRNV
jgi:hypothetical protein